MNVRAAIRLAVPLIIFQYAATAIAGTPQQSGCPEQYAAQASAADKASEQSQALAPTVGNPTVQDITGPQCTNSGSTFETILQDLQSMPIGSQGQQILQVIEQLFGPEENACDPSNTTSTATPTPTEAIPSIQIQTPTTVATTSTENNGAGSSSQLYQSLFPGA